MDGEIIRAERSPGVFDTYVEKVDDYTKCAVAVYLPEVGVVITLCLAAYIRRLLIPIIK
jgi:hypothetical protein